MSTSEINRLLGLLDDWVQALEESRLSEACREEGRDFFRFMQARGVNAALMAKLIIDTTGYNPAQLWRVEDAEMLRDAIFRYAGSVVVTQVEERHGIQNTAERNVRHFWS